MAGLLGYIAVFFILVEVAVQDKGGGCGVGSNDFGDKVA
jgi:hypothetical protein